MLIVGVIFDLTKQLEFYKAILDSGLDNWTVCYVASDEIEAEIKKSYLESKGIAALIEPLRFTWGLPIRTVVDQYRIYVAQEKKDQARELIA